MGPNCHLQHQHVFQIHLHPQPPQALEARRFILIFASPGSLMGPNFHLQHQHVFHLHPQAQIP